MRQLSDTLLARIKSGVVVLGRSGEGKSPYRANFIRLDEQGSGRSGNQRTSSDCRRRGGGKADMAEGGGNQPEKLADALGESYNIIERLLGKAAAT